MARLTIHRFLYAVAIHNDQGERHAGGRQAECGVNDRFRYAVNSGLAEALSWKAYLRSVCACDLNSNYSDSATPQGL